MPLESSPKQVEYPGPTRQSSIREFNINTPTSIGGPSGGPEQESVDALNRITDIEGQLFLTRRIVDELPKLAPETMEKVGFGAVALGPLVKNGDRPWMMGYVIGHDSRRDPRAVPLVVPRIFYKSTSDGGWRVSLGFDEQGRYIKVDDDKAHDGGYTQFSKPVESVVHMLEKQEQASDGVELTDDEAAKIKDMFRINRFTHPSQRTQPEPQIQEGIFQPNEVTVEYLFDEESDVYQLYSPGTGYLVEASKARKALAAMTLPDGFTPSFDHPERSYSFEHTTGGHAEVEVFMGIYRTEPIEWHMATDQNGTVWVERIIAKGTEMSSYGTYNRVFLAGVLNAKPYEYAQQVQGMEEGIDYTVLDPTKPFSNVSLRPFLDNLPWIRAYRAREGKTTIDR